MKTFRIAIALVVAGVIFMPRGVLLAKENSFEISVDRSKVGVGQALQLNLTFNDTQDMPALELPALEGFQARYLGPSTRMSIVNGQVSSSVTHVYTLLPTKVGTFKIGPFTFEHSGDSYRSNVISVDVGESSPSEGEQSVGGDQIETKDLSDRIFVVLRVEKNKIYLNEVVPVTVKLFVNDLGVRDIQYPQFNHDGFSLGGVEKPRQYQQVISGVSYEVIEFNTTIFGLRPGEFRLGPVNLQCNLIVKKENRRGAQNPFGSLFDSNVFEDFFGRYESYPLNLKSADIPITVMALPEDNKPEGFSGALGVFDFGVSVSPTEVKVGDPITVKATVRGQGNLNTVTMPAAHFGDDFKTYEPQVKQEQEAKTFEQVLIALNSNAKEVPGFRFDYFNTQTGKYETITKGPFPITVVKPDKEEESRMVESRQPAVSSSKEEKLGRDIIFIKETDGRLKKKDNGLYKNKVFLGLQLVPALLYLLTVVFYARKRKLKNNVRYARQLIAPHKAKTGLRKAKGYLGRGETKEFYDALFETVQEYLGDKFHLPSQAITISVIDEQLRSKGVTEEVLAKLRDIFKECDMVRYAASQLTGDTMKNSLRNLEEVIDYLQRYRI